MQGGGRGTLGNNTGRRSRGVYQFFSRDTRHLGTNCGRGQELTDALIECMVKK